VAFANDVESDARRRDFTMNALYASRDGRITDPLGGLPDLQARRVRFIDDPEQRIREDYLRILRFFRFHAWYGDPDEGLDAEGLAAVAALSDGLETLSRERVGSEILKLLSAPDPAPSVAAMQQAGVLSCVLPGADGTALAVLVHNEGQVGVSPCSIRRLAAIGGEDVSERLRLSRDQSRRLTLLRNAIQETAPLPEIGYRYGIETGTDIVLLRGALLGEPVEAAMLETLRHGAEQVFPVRADDLIPAYEGKALGEKLRQLEDEWISSGFTLSRDALLGLNGHSD
jgi:poly(A) polymerase